MVEHVFEEGSVGDGEDGLGEVICEGAEACAFAARENDCG